MAVIPTGDIFKTLTLDGVSSKDYSVYITGEAVFNSPARDVEMITIPGRNGSFALDKGRFENIEVTYPAGIAADTEAEFREAISDFRNFLASRNGYVRLEDDYNPNEYRLAVYKSGLDVTPAQLRAGEFDITFDCKPQRYLKTGEDAISVDSGDVVSNPTLFASSPMLEVEGYGTIDWGDGEIKVENGPIGDIVVHESSGGAGSSSLSWTIDDHLANVGDALTVSSSLCQMRINYVRSADSYDYTTTGNPVVSVRYTKTTAILGVFHIDISPAPFTFAYGTASSKTATVSGTAVHNGSTDTFDITITCAYDGSTGFTLTLSVSVSTYMDYNDNYIDQFQTGRTVLNSSQSALGNPLYIDLELGYAYKYENDNPVSVNNGIILPATLPTLAPGANTITFDNTITDLKVIPRWWKI